MALDATNLTNQFVAAGQQLGANLWNNIKTFAVPELQKIAIQIVAIEAGTIKNPPDFTPEGAKALFNMQVTATVGVIVAMTTLTLLAVQTAINQILDAVKAAVNVAIGFPLIG